MYPKPNPWPILSRCCCPSLLTNFLSADAGRGFTGANFSHIPLLPLSVSMYCAAVTEIDKERRGEVEVL